ncbi:MAG: type III secretion system inner membrane ring subunit SctD [Verrucomicrobiota bacterium]|nr:type III secretion system inner membrane ring subunit SctD [Verrucomicrobiota bacterium]
MTAHFIGEEGIGQNLIFDIQEGEEKIIGRDPDEATLVIEDPTVSRQHARLFFAPEGVYLENLSRISPTRVNAAPIEGHVLLQEDDRVQIGRTLFRFTEKEAVAKTPEKEPLFVEPQGMAPQQTSYDTIFEDRGEEELPPFPLLPEPPFLLKVISGPNTGAEIGLDRNKSYTLGKDPHLCEIVFQDVSVSRKHAKISVSAEGSVEIEDLESKNGTLVNNKKIEGRITIGSQDLIAIGTTLFIVLDREAPQETLFSPLPAFHAQGEAPTKEEGLEEEVAAKEGLEEPEWRLRPIPLKYLTLLGGALVSALVVFVTFFSLCKTETVAMEENPEKILEKSLEKFAGVRFSFNPASGKLFLVGHLLKGTEAQELLYTVGTFDFVTSVENNVVIDESVDKMMNELLSSHADFRSVTIQSLAPGRFVAIGYMETNTQLALLTDYLNMNFPYLDHLEYRVAVEENITLEIAMLLEKFGFVQITFRVANGEVTLAGHYSYKKKGVFAEMLQALRAVQGIRTVNNFAIISAAQGMINISSSYQITGTAEKNGKGVSVIINGKLYEKGDLLDGMTLIEITPHMILLDKDGVTYIINNMR